MTSNLPLPTIFALSSGSPPAAIAVIRISGGEAGAVLVRLVGKLPLPRMASLRRLRNANGEILDRALVLWFPAPKTATGEDLAELHLHGGRATVAAVLAMLAEMPGLRAAEAGEFTRRAFTNGVVDLLQAEGLADLLAAESEAGRREALHRAEGGLGCLIEGWRGHLLAFAARAEASLQFGDDEEDVPRDPALTEGLLVLAEELDARLASPPAERLRDGVRIMLAGPPNAGKSSLMNVLAARDVAIESPEAGTTRDILEAPVLLCGLPCVLIDSAGLRDPTSEIEKDGIARARRALDAADLVLWLGDEAAPAVTNVLHLHARSDLVGRTRVPAGRLPVSARTGEGVEALRKEIVERLGKELPVEGALLNARQRACVANVADGLRSAAGATAPELLCEELRMCLLELDRLMGNADVECVLDAIFSSFCVGK